MSEQPTAVLRPVEEVLAQFVRITDPPTRSNSWASSRIGIYADGSYAPILTTLAQEKFGPYDPELMLAYWRDKNWRNETWDNVMLTERQQRTSRGRNNPYGAPAGTKEYWKNYRAVNREKMRGYQRASLVRQKAVAKAVRDRDQEMINDLLKGDPDGAI